MRILFFAPLTIQVEAAKRLGFHVTSVWHRYEGPNFFEKVIADVKELSDVFIEGDLYKDEAWLDLLAETFAAYPETTVIPGVPDDFLPAFLKAVQKLNRLPQPLPVYDFFKSKLSLRRLLNQVPHLSAQHVSIETKADLKKILARTLPTSILKPVSSSGSKNISLIACREDAQAAIKKWQSSHEPLGLILEEFLDGPQFSVEGISRSGQHIVLGITEKFPVVAPHFIENGGVFPAQIQESLADEIAKAVITFLKKSGFQNGPTHTEVIATGNGVKIVESNIRMGGLIPFLIEGAHGVNPNEFLVQYLTGQKDGYIPVKNEVAVLGILNFGADKLLEGVDGQETVRSYPFVVKLNIWARTGQVLSTPVNNEQRHGYVVVTGANYNEALTRFKIVQQQLLPRFKEVPCPTFQRSSI